MENKILNNNLEIKIKDVESNINSYIKWLNNNKHSDINISNLKAVFCGRLLRYYFWSYEYKNIQVDLKKKFNMNAKYVLNSKKLNCKEKSVYILFRISPVLCKKIFGKVLNI